MAAGFKLAVLTVDGPIEVQLPCNLDDDMNIVIENKGVPYPEGRGIHHVSLISTLPACCLSWRHLHISMFICNMDCSAMNICMISGRCIQMSLDKFGLLHCKGYLFISRLF